LDLTARAEIALALELLGEEIADVVDGGRHLGRYLELSRAEKTR